LKGLRTRTVLGLLGNVTLRRHYYHCPECCHGTAPWDQTLGLDTRRQTPAAKQIIALGGTIDPFGESAQKVIRKMSGLTVSESTVRRRTEEVGAQIGGALAQGDVFGAVTPWAWHKDAEGKTVAYVAGDATGVGIQGPKGAEAEGRMINVGMIYNPIPDEPQRWANPQGKRPSWQARYATSLNGMGALGTPLRQQGGQVGMDGADRWIGLSDGGSGLEEFLKINFPRLEVVILDFYHAAEYLGEIARAWFPADEAGAAAWLEPWCHRLKHEGGAAVLAGLRDLQTALGVSGMPRAAQVRLEEALRYFENQKHRMDYPSYRAKGWHIGSGPVESACKTVIGMRMKQAGMRWAPHHADAVAHIRALFRSEDRQWDAFWEQKHKKKSPQL
jgi:hypothetical protein